MTSWMHTSARLALLSTSLGLGPAFAEPAVGPASATTYTVKKGDRLATLAAERYGSEHYAGLLAAFNRVDPARLAAGQALSLPTVEAMVGERGAGLARARALFLTVDSRLMALARSAPSKPPSAELKQPLVEAAASVGAAVAALSASVKPPKSAIGQAKSAQALLTDLANRGPDENGYSVTDTHRRLAYAMEYLVRDAAAPAAPTSAGAGAGAGCQPPTAQTPVTWSPDGKLAVYAQVDPRRKLSSAVGELPYQDLCIQRAGEAPAVLVAGHEAAADADVSETLADFDNLRFSPDGATLYFSTAAWATSSAAHAVDLASGKQRFLTDGVVAAQLDRGPYKGLLLVESHRLDDEHAVDSDQYRGRVEVWTVIGADGKTVARLPDDPKARAKAIQGQ